MLTIDTSNGVLSSPGVQEHAETHNQITEADSLWLSLFKTECQLTTLRKLEPQAAKIRTTASSSSPVRPTKQFHSANAVKCPYELDISKIESLPLPGILTDARLTSVQDLKCQLRVSWFDLENASFFGKTWICPGQISLLDRREDVEEIAGSAATATPISRRMSRASTRQSKSNKPSSAKSPSRSSPTPQSTKNSKQSKPVKMKKKKRKSKSSILSDSLDSSISSTTDDLSDDSSSSDDSEDRSDYESDSDDEDEKDVDNRSVNPSSPTRSVVASTMPARSLNLTKYISGHQLTIKLREQQVKTILTLI